ncbi:MAG TPA: 5'-nucleotidase, partial [Candidatus Tectomicrobia bacterium]|nr:5'-nucleotidase [Candidatus Tectomicrobia bacterium]
IRAALEQGLAQRDRAGGGFLQVSGLRLAYDPAAPAGSRVRSLAIGGAPVEAERRYTVAVVDYLLRGGDGLTAFGDARVLLDAVSGPLVAEVVTRAIERAGTIAPAVEGRIVTAGP